MRNVLVRAGLLALGIVYVSMGAVTVRVAWRGARDPVGGMPGALKFILDQPLGPWLLGAVVAGLAGLAAVHALEALRGPGGWIARAGAAANAFGYAALAGTSARLLLRLKAGSDDRLERDGVSWLLGKSWGAAALELVAAGVVLGGLWEISEGLRGKLGLRRDRLSRPGMHVLFAVARFGLVARGLVLCALGYFVFRAAEELDPAAVRSLGGTLDAFSHTALGPAFSALVGLGLAAYGVYIWAQAFLKRRV